jgi:hypothetical protein
MKQVVDVLMSALMNLGVFDANVLKDLYLVQISRPVRMLMSVSLVIVKMTQVTVAHIVV